jgi:hypothetical protein
VELNLVNRKFTWSNNQDVPVMARLDRFFFVSTEWDRAYPLVRVSALPKEISDHTPLLVDTGGNQTFEKKKFRFKIWWIERADFRGVVARAWNTNCSSRNPMEVW